MASLPNTKGGIRAAADYHLGVEVEDDVLDSIFVPLESVLKFVCCIVEELDDSFIRRNC
jgi:hypothetical protein